MCDRADPSKSHNQDSDNGVARERRVPGSFRAQTPCKQASKQASKQERERERESERVSASAKCYRLRSGVVTMALPGRGRPGYRRTRDGQQQVARRVRMTSRF